MRISDWSSDVCSSDLNGRPEYGGFRVLKLLRPTSQYVEHLWQGAERRPFHNVDDDQRLHAAAREVVADARGDRTAHNQGEQTGDVESFWMKEAIKMKRESRLMFGTKI